MSEIAQIKIALRELIKKMPTDSISLQRPINSRIILYFSSLPKRSYVLTLGEYDDNGDPTSDAEYDQMYSQIVALVDSHNQSL